MFGETQDALEEWKQAANEAAAERDAVQDERDGLFAEWEWLDEEREQSRATTRSIT